MEFKVVTICNRTPTQDYYCLESWHKSLRGTEPLILGTKPGEYGGLGSKPRLLYHAIKNGLIPEKYIMFTDCWDLVFQFPPTDSFTSYKIDFNDCPLVISAEKNCFPGDLKEDYDKLYDGNSPYKYLNSGFIIGHTEAMLAALESMDAKNIPNDYWDAEKNCQINPNDQLYWQQEFLKQPVRIELDRKQSMCQTLHQVTLDELDMTTKRIRNKETNEFSCAYHFNGSGKTDGCRIPILKHLNLL